MKKDEDAKISERRGIKEKRNDLNLQSIKGWKGYWNKSVTIRNRKCNKIIYLENFIKVFWRNWKEQVFVKRKLKKRSNNKRT